MSHLNPHATEWKPTGNNEHGMTELALPPATAPSGEAGQAAHPGSEGEAAEAAARASLNATPLGKSSTASAAPPSHIPVYIPSYMTGGDPAIAEQLANIDWDAEFKQLMELTGQMIERQLAGLDGDPRPVATTDAVAGGHGGENIKSSGDTRQATSGHAGQATAVAPLPLTYASAVKGAAAATAAAPFTAAPVARKPATLGVANTRHTALMGMVDMDDSASMAPTLETMRSGAGKHHWKKLTKAQQRNEQSQRNAFEAFANALLHSVSPFMAPLRAKCKTSLPHIKVDQRFGKSGQPETAIAQFLVAPLVTNYRPRHFHDVAPGELMEFHYDFAQVLQAISSVYAIHIGYGPTWKRYAVPYCFLACREYRKEVLALCPEEIPNSRSEAMYEDDVVKDITELLLKRGEGLEILEKMSICEAMRKRVDLYPLYDAFATIFQSLENYQVEITNIRTAPSRFLVKTSRLAVEAMPQPIILDDDVAWDELPEVSRVLVQDGVAATSAMKSPADASAPTTTTAPPRTAPTQPHRTVDNAAPAKGVPPSVKGDHVGGSPSVATSRRPDTLWQTAVPLLVSAACVAVTVTALLLKKRT